MTFKITYNVELCEIIIALFWQVCQCFRSGLLCPRKRGHQTTYNITMRYDFATIIAVDKQ